MSNHIATEAKWADSSPPIYLKLAFGRMLVRILTLISIWADKLQ
jgi:hypothetical protein